MKHRVRLDLSFESESDAAALVECTRQLLPRAAIINAGADNEERGFCEHELCRHDEGLPCTLVEKLEVGEVLV